MNIVILAPMVRIGMRLYLQRLLDEAAIAGARVTVIAPDHVDIDTAYPIVKIRGGSKWAVAWAQVSPFTFLRIAFTMIRGHFELLHIINGENRPMVLWALLLARILGIRSLVTVHDPLPHPCARLDVATHRLGVLSRQLADELNIHDKAHLPIVDEGQGKPIHVFPLPDISKSFPKPSVFQKEQEVLFFGRMEPYKGIDNFVELGLRMRGEARFVLAGAGNIPAALLERMRENPDIFVIEHRYISDEEMIGFMDRAKVLLLPYHNATQSGAPPVAAARGAMPIGFAVGGLANQLPALGGIAVAAGDLDALERAVRTGLATSESALYQLTLQSDPFEGAVRELYSAQNLLTPIVVA
ncbi:glycosyltransferase involved in cell wall biosynthesis [Sphingomonas sp. SORGH_AS 950]|uniref:glycosyltransferase n=1 Tax=Sphingomonas sp. SORGH_AS_0950 TaxID=3041792 RepID=UPI00278B58F0|nr:glycosyltransferase [Sphingomonas sp. SORGH_AS_0950]MDQ1159443.1 glycosyltransferase involved in cell wall biosynthesis [Sphingomonas sp. SORGH_AS_0950]